MLDSIFIKVEGLQACKFIKKRLQSRCFPVNIAKFSEATSFRELLWWLLLSKQKSIPLG